MFLIVLLAKSVWVVNHRESEETALMVYNVFHHKEVLEALITAVTIQLPFSYHSVTIQLPFMHFFISFSSHSSFLLNTVYVPICPVNVCSVLNVHNA